MSSIIAILSVNTLIPIRPTWRRSRVALVWALVWVVVLWITPGWSTLQHQEPEAEPDSEGEILLDRWQAEAARQWAAQRVARDPHEPRSRSVLAQALFYLGRYTEALDVFSQLLQQVPDPRLQAYRDFIANTLTSVAGLTLVETPHFRIYLDRERDAALVPYMQEVLEQSYERLGAIFGFAPTEKIRVEIFPTTATFYPASSLSARDIEVSGAIGICKFNKIMLLSPRNLARGYRWTDALSHEYVHYILVHVSHNRAPIWVHEGMAKYFESVWRAPQSAWLDRRSESLLAHALRNNSFVGFKNMEPSLVKLETNYQVQLAYAEASSAIDFIAQRLGAAGLLQVLQTLRQPQIASAADAVAQVTGLAFEAFQEQWRSFLAAKQLQEHPGIQLPRFELKKDDSTLSGDEVQEALQSQTARRNVHLGDRLRQHGRAPAAVMEYRRALAQAPASPYVLNKLAIALMAQGQWLEARPYLQQTLQVSPDDATAYTNLGRIALALQEYEPARQALREAVQINPFDPALHQYLAEAYRQLGQSEHAQQEQQLAEHLQRTP